MSVSDLDRYLFDLRGFIVIRSVLDGATLRRLNDFLDRQGLADLDDDDRTRRLGWLPDFGGPFLDLIDHPGILPYLVAFVDERVRLDHAYGIQMVPGSPGLGLHGFPDDRPRNCAWYRVRNGCISSGLTVVTFALTDAPASAGGFVCIAGSHKANFANPLLEQSTESHREWLTQVDLRAGDAVIFTEALTHGSHDWQGPGIRRALLYKYAPGQSAWLTHHWSPEELEPLTARQRALVGPPGVHHPDSGERRPIEFGPLSQA